MNIHVLSLKCQCKIMSKLGLKAKEWFSFYRNLPVTWHESYKFTLQGCIQIQSDLDLFSFCMFFFICLLSVRCRSVHVFNHFVSRTQSNDNMNNTKASPIATSGAKFISFVNLCASKWETIDQSEQKRGTLPKQWGKKVTHATTPRNKQTEKKTCFLCFEIDYVCYIAMLSKISMTLSLITFEMVEFYTFQLSYVDSEFVSKEKKKPYSFH